MYTPINTLTIEILSVFITRIGIILNKIQQKLVYSYRSDQMIYSISPENGPCIICLIEPGETDTIILWNNTTENKYNNIRTNNQTFFDLTVNNNLELFTKKEQKIMEELIELEKQEADKIKVTEYFECLKNSQKPLGSEFEQVLEEN